MKWDTWYLCESALARQAELPGKNLSLVLPWRVVVVVVESDLAHRDHPR